MNARPILATPCDGASPTAPARPVQADSKKNGESSASSTAFRAECPTYEEELR